MLQTIYNQGLTIGKIINNVPKRSKIMKILLTLASCALITGSMLNAQPDCEATTIRTAFNRETSVSIPIKADASVIWALLTNAQDYPRWNSTVTSLEGTIALGEKIKLKSILDEKRTFKLKVTELEPNSRLVWGDGKGTRVYTLSPQEDGSILFNMDEKLGSFLFPIYAEMIPSFDESFEQFAHDLKKEAESGLRSQ